MLLMAAMGVLLVVGLGLCASWAARPYVPWRAASGDPPKAAALVFSRAAVVALVGGFWAGALVTGPAVRLVMRLLAVTAGDDAQGRITEAGEVVGEIDADDTLGLYVFGGMLPGLLSGAAYVVVRRLLPAGWVGGVVFGIFHLVVAATRVDPLRADNVDFGLVGPGWLAVATFGLTTIAHGVAVVAFANRYSAEFPPAPGRRLVVIAPLAVPLLFIVPTSLVLIPIALARIAIAVAIDPGPRASPRVVVVGRVVAVAIGLALLPGTVVDLADIVAGGP